jgi:hypothetical protein
MFDEVIGKIRQAINPKSGLSSGISPVLGKGYMPIMMTRENFHNLSNQAGLGRIAFIDGGSAEILSSQSFLLGIIRASCVIFDDKKRIAQEICEFLVFSRPSVNGRDINFDVSFHRLKGTLRMDDISFSGEDETLKSGISNAEMKSVLNVARRFLEIKLATKIAENSSASFILLDGILKCTFTHEENMLEHLYTASEKSKTILCALSKSSSIISPDGSSFSSSLLNSAPFDSWLYHPVADSSLKIHKAYISFAKMHPKSHSAFKIEIFERQKAELGKAVAVIKEYCRDPIFLGYPYGLIEADRMARVSNAERQSLKDNVIARLGKDGRATASLNPHDVLDRISF